MRRGVRCEKRPTIGVYGERGRSENTGVYEAGGAYRGNSDASIDAAVAIIIGGRNDGARATVVLVIEFDIRHAVRAVIWGWLQRSCYDDG